MKQRKKMILAFSVVTFCILCGVGKAQAYGGVTIVAKSGGNYTGPITAMNAVNRWCQRGPSADNPCLIKIMPGVYDLGTQTLKMRPYVDIEGSGEITTILTGAANHPSLTPTAGVVNGASNAEIRFLTVKAMNGVAIYNDNSSPKLTHVAASASGIYSYDFMMAGVYNLSSSPVMKDMNVSVSGGGGSGYTEIYGVYNDKSSPEMRNVAVSATVGSIFQNTGVHNTSSSPAMENVIVTASRGKSQWGIENESSSSPRMLNVTVTVSGGEWSGGIYNENSTPKMMNVTVDVSESDEATGIVNDNSSPVMMNVTVNASGGGTSIDGVINDSSSPLMTNATVSASGGGHNSGVVNFDSSPVMMNVKALGLDGFLVEGIYNDNSSPVMTNVTATGVPRIGQNGMSYGMTNYNRAGGSYTIIVDRSSFEGSTYSIDNDPGFTLKIGASKLIGPANTLGIYQCVGSYNEGYASLNTTCQ